MNTALCFSESE